MNKIWITDDFMCKISKYTPNVHTCIGIYPAYCITVCLHTHSRKHIQACTLAEWNEKFVDCHFNVYTDTYTFLFILQGENDVCCKGVLWKSYWHWFQMHSIRFINVYVTEGERECEICTSNAYYTISQHLPSEEDLPICLNVLFGKLSPCISRNMQTNKQINKSYKSNKIKMYHIENARIHALILSALFERHCKRCCEKIQHGKWWSIAFIFFIHEMSNLFKVFETFSDGNTSHGFKINYQSGMWWCWWFNTFWERHFRIREWNVLEKSAWQI